MEVPPTHTANLKLILKRIEMYTTDENKRKSLLLNQIPEHWAEKIIDMIDDKSFDELKNFILTHQPLKSTIYQFN